MNHRGFVGSNVPVWREIPRIVCVMSAVLSICDPCRGADNSPATESAVQLRPFKVIGEWMDIQPILKSGKVEYVRVLNLRMSTPAAIAGVRNDMRILKFQGIDVRGLTEEDLGRKIDALPPGPTLTLLVKGVLENRELVIPLSHRMPLRPADSGAPKQPATGSESVADNAPQETPKPAATSALRNEPRPVEPDVTGETTRKRLTELRKAVEAEWTRSFEMAKAEARAKNTKSFTVQPNQALLSEASQIATDAAGANLAVACEIAAEVARSNPSSQFLSMLTESINRRRDYSSDQKPIVLQCLPTVPALIVTLDRMNWLAGAEAAIAAGWKKASTDERDGMLTRSSSRYAIVAARTGLIEALVALARTVQMPDAGKRMGGNLLREESAALKTLVPLDGENIKALATFVVKNKAKLTFNREKSVYTVRP